MKTSFTIVLNHKNIGKTPLGHQAHQGGGGVRKDKRTKRLRTRSTQERAALRD